MTGWLKRFSSLCLALLHPWIVARAAETPPLMVDAEVLRVEQARVVVMDQASRAAITILADGGKDGGSGVLISADGYALSNFHVTSAAGVAFKCGLSDGELYDGVIVGVDPVGDVALVKLFGRDDFPHARLGDSDRVEVGDWAFTVGNPFLLATDFRPSVSWGIISGTHRYQYPAGTLLEYADCLQTDASINPGNSGGPLFDATGELIGINGRGSFEKRGRVNVGVGYAISINQIKNFLGHLRGGRIVDHATLGAVVGTDDQDHVIVTEILEDSDAYRRGLRYGDEIVSFGGRPIRTVNAFKNVLGIFPRGWQVPLSFRHEGQTHEVFVRLAGVHGIQELADKLQARPKETETPPIGPPSGDEQPAPRKPQPDPEPRRPKRGKAPVAHKNPKAELPEIARKHFVERRGYANYFFNRMERDRVWQSAQSAGDLRSAGSWQLTGSWLAPDDCTLEIGDRRVAADLPGGRVALDQIESLVAATAPEGTGGLLAALYVWRRLLTVGPEKFGDLHYLGFAPLADQVERVDALAGTYGGIEATFAFDPQTGRLLRVEMFLSPDDDPCQLRFESWSEQHGRLLPGEIQIWAAGREYARLRQVRWTFVPTGER